MTVEKPFISVSNVEKELLRRDLCFQHTSEMIAIYNLTGEEVFANPIHEKTFMKKSPLSQTISDSQMVSTIIQKSVDGWIGEIKSNTLLGMRWHNLQSCRMKDPVLDEEVILIIRQDITKLKQLEDLKKEFVSIVSHELRTPITSIQGALQLVTSGVCGTLPLHAKKMIDIAVRNSHRLLKQVNDLLDAQKLQNKSISKDFVRLSFAALLLGNEPDYRLLVEKEGLSLKVEIQDEDMMVFGDSHRLGQILLNLLSNAIKYSSKGDELTIIARKNGKMAQISVQDHGPGIPDSFQKKLFERFTQVNSTDGRSHAGLGLGLYIAQVLTQVHKGKLFFESTEGMGTTFYLEIPLLEEMPLEQNNE